MRLSHGYNIFKLHGKFVALPPVIKYRQPNSDQFKGLVTTRRVQNDYLETGLLQDYIALNEFLFSLVIKSQPSWRMACD